MEERLTELKAFLKSSLTRMSSCVAAEAAKRRAAKVAASKPSRWPTPICPTATSESTTSLTANLPIALAARRRRISPHAIGRRSPLDFSSATSRAPKRKGRTGAGTSPFAILVLSAVSLSRKAGPPADVHIWRTSAERPLGPAALPAGKLNRDLRMSDVVSGVRSAGADSSCEMGSSCRGCFAFNRSAVSADRGADLAARSAETALPYRPAFVSQSAFLTASGGRESASMVVSQAMPCGA